MSKPGRRPVLVVSSDAINHQPLVITVIVGTDAANIQRDYPTISGSPQPNPVYPWIRSSSLSKRDRWTMPASPSPQPAPSHLLAWRKSRTPSGSRWSSTPPPWRLLVKCSRLTISQPALEPDPKPELHVPRPAPGACVGTCPKFHLAPGAPIDSQSVPDPGPSDRRHSTSRRMKKNTRDQNVSQRNSHE